MVAWRDLHDDSLDYRFAEVGDRQAGLRIDSVLVSNDGRPPRRGCESTSSGTAEAPAALHPGEQLLGLDRREAEVQTSVEALKVVEMLRCHRALSDPRAHRRGCLVAAQSAEDAV